MKNVETINNIRQQLAGVIFLRLGITRGRLKDFKRVDYVHMYVLCTVCHLGALKLLHIDMEEASMAICSI